jgi:thiol:disulfide interchange protein DsbD
VTYQGCADAGFCYPPETKIVPLGNALARSGDRTTKAQPASAAGNAPGAAGRVAI